MSTSRGIYRLKELNPSLDVGELSVLLGSLSSGALSITVYGSAARGKYVRGLSDVDVLVVTAGEPPCRARTFGLSLGDVNVVYMSREEFCGALTLGNQIALEAVSAGVVVFGEDPKNLCGNPPEQEKSPPVGLTPTTCGRH
ncbi:nucleotidyltransferase domain-containing protein [Infirmifilum lucidum]|uniref:Nucleotidyltransferase domain-containing protein n=1 Tax=Infirmifilum lucidum TaxID=2776706 RepID=A0A7L9FHE1_9CREN|nr:nucleotidyltransferase domain-containing protein [Infirmifilum lucidum]QOJ78762.1 nucleotidyltransferase domain-containing protein [Infirmifilum lucidum]